MAKTLLIVIVGLALIGSIPVILEFRYGAYHGMSRSDIQDLQRTFPGLAQK